MKKSLKKRDKRIIFVFGLVSILLLLFFVGWYIKENNYKQHLARIDEKSSAVDALQSKVSVLKSVVNSTNELVKSTNGLVAMPDNLMDTSNDVYTDQESANWQKCYSGLEKFNKSLPGFREKSAQLDGDDAKLYNAWLSNGEKLSEWSICYKNFIYTKTSKAPDADTNLKNYKDRINGRVIILNKQLNDAKTILVKAQSDKYFLWW